MPYTPHFVSTPEIIIETGAGATAWASAARGWNGNRKALLANPAMRNANAAPVTMF